MTMCHEWLPLLRQMLSADLNHIRAWLAPQNLYRQHLVLGYDAGPLAAEAAGLVAAFLAAQGLRVFASSRPCPRPAFAFALGNKRAAAGLYVHSDAAGLQLDCYDRQLQAVDLAALPVRADAADFAPDPASPGSEPGQIEWFDARTPYQCHLLNQVLTDTIRVLGDGGARVVLDTQYGAASGYLEPVLRQLGFSHRDNFSIRCEIDRVVARDRLTLAGGDLEPLINKVLYYELDLGVAINGDGTDLALIDGRGERLTLSERAAGALAAPVPDALLALLLYLEDLGAQEMAAASAGDDAAR